MALLAELKEIFNF